MELPRRTIEELLARYELEPSLADIYVEGSVDADVINWYFRERAIQNVQAYEIETVHIPADTLERYRLSPGNRQYVIALARQLDGKASMSQVACVIDLDMDNWLGNQEAISSLLVKTDFVGLELYVLESRVMSKFLRLIVSDSQTSADSVIGNLRNVLQDCFLIRLAHTCLNLPLDWLTPERCCTISETKDVVFDREEFLSRLLMKNGNISSRAIIASKIEEFKSQLGTDLRRQCHGHDFLLIFGWYLGNLGHSWLRNPRQLLRALLGCLVVADLATQVLFIQLETRLHR